MVAPLCTARLRQTRQKTQKAVANITGTLLNAEETTGFNTSLALRRWRGVHGVPEGEEW